jgi:outer membrane protein
MPRAACISLAATIALFCLPARASDAQLRISAGPGLLIVPKYPGAAEQDALPIVDIDAAYGRFFLNSRHGAGAYLLDTETRHAGVSLWFRRGRHRHDGDRVAHLESIDDAPAAHAFFSQSFGSMALSASVTQALAKTGGVSADSSAAWQLRLANATSVQVGVRATIGDPRYMKTWFDADAGLASIGGFASIMYGLSRDWTINAFAACDVLVGEARNSRAVERETMPTFAVSILRHFGRN